MNAEYQHHKQVWEMLKPRVYSQIEPTEPLAWACPPAVAPVPEFPGWYPASMELAVPARGLPELTSPLSDW